MRERGIRRELASALWTEKKQKWTAWHINVKRKNLNDINEEPSTAKKHKLYDYNIARNPLKHMTLNVKIVLSAVSLEIFSISYLNLHEKHSKPWVGENKRILSNCL